MVDRASKGNFNRSLAGGIPLDDEHCKIHTDTRLVKYCPACRGSAGGRVSSPAKIASSRANAQLGGKRGGRPPNHSPECDVTSTGRYTRDCPRCSYDAKRLNQVGKKRKPARRKR